MANSYQRSLFYSYTTLSDNGEPITRVYGSGFGVNHGVNSTTFYVLDNDCRYVQTTEENYNQVRQQQESIATPDEFVAIQRPFVAEGFCPRRTVTDMIRDGLHSRLDWELALLRRENATLREQLQED